MAFLAKLLASSVFKKALIGVFEILAKHTETDVDDDLVVVVKQALGE